MLARASGQSTPILGRPKSRALLDTYLCGHVASARYDESSQEIEGLLMGAVRRSNERGMTDQGWLKSFHTFSFAEYFDPKFIEFGVLRVINEDRVQAGAGFGTHSHKNMEIISYVLSGELAHKDSMGNGSTIFSGDVQRMSAGSGITHGEFNPSSTEPLHFLQIWIKPNVLNIKPSYEERRFPQSEKRGRLRLIVSPDGGDGSLSMRQDAKLYSGLFDTNEVALLPGTRGRAIYVHVARGDIDANGITLSGGDALRIVDASSLTLERGRAAEVLVFDLPPITSSGG
jgi:redox-sensitive bicupin YhaK (pirin superfamily)